jgi:hypothetical protein
MPDKPETAEEYLKKGTLRCPHCKELLHFRVVGNMRIIENGLYEARCPNSNRYYNIKA